MNRILLAGGGTLGSVSPLIAITEEMSDTNFLFVGTKDGIEKTFVESQGLQFTAIPSIRFRRYFTLRTVVDVCKVPFALYRSYKVVSRFNPNAILTSGGFVAVPISLIAYILRKPVFVHQQDIQIGLANTILSKIATHITVSLPSQEKLFPGNKTTVTGNPCRRINSSQKTVPRRILILGGSSGARGMNESIRPYIEKLAKTCTIVHVLGNSNFNQRYSIKENYRAVRFLGKEYADELAQAQIVISRAGMSTITELAQYKKAAVLIPMPRSHQEINAHYFNKKNAALIHEQLGTSDLEETITNLLSNSVRIRELGTNLRELFPENATLKYIKLIQSHTGTSTSKIAYIIGAGGIGVSQIARYLTSAGYEVHGSDVATNQVLTSLKDEGMHMHVGHSKHHIPKQTDICVYTDAVPGTNEELLYCRDSFIPTYTYHQYLGKISQKFNTIAITGTHGKTTTTAITGCILLDTHKDPTVFVGSLVPQFDNKNIRIGNSDLFIVEADEYKGHMLHLNPKSILITNIEADHLDFYKDIDDIIDYYKKFIAKLPNNGLLILNGDDPYTKQLSFKHRISFGFAESNDYVIAEEGSDDMIQKFSLTKKGERIGLYEINLPGKYNIYNAAAAAVIADLNGISNIDVASSLSAFKGTWRRFELIGSYNSMPAYSDYAHHPTAIRSVLRGAKKAFSNKKIIAVFQPHSYNRTHHLFNDFLNAFSDSDAVILADIYDVVGRDENRSVSGSKLYASLDHQKKFYASNLTDIPKLLDQNKSNDSIILFIGAGTIDSFARSIVT